MTGRGQEEALLRFKSQGEKPMAEARSTHDFVSVEDLGCKQLIWGQSSRSTGKRLEKGCRNEEEARQGRVLSRLLL